MNYEFELSKENLERSLLENTLHRNHKLNNLLKLINSLKRNTIIAIDGAWGTGKTIFVKQLETVHKGNFKDDEGNDIEIPDIDPRIKNEFNKKHGVYYYNAWENDLHRDPLQSLLFFLLNELPNNEDMIVDFDEFKKKIPLYIYKIIGGLKSGAIEKINTETKKITGIDVKKLADATIDLIGDIENLKDYEQLAERIITTNEIKDAIDDLINNLLKKDSKIVFIIDELDRCKPDYAVKLLETITHFYSNDKIIFLVSCNSEQLSHTISKFYGEQFDSYEYLNKIFNFMIMLGNINPQEYFQLVVKSPLTDYFFDQMACAVFEHYHFTMREIGRYLYYMEVLTDYYYKEEKRKESIIKYCFLPYLLGLKLKNIEQYYKFLNGDGLNDFLEFYTKNKRCQSIVDNIYNSYIYMEEREKITPEDFIKNIYDKYFAHIDNDKYNDRIIKERLVEVLSLISDLTSL